MLPQCVRTDTTARQWYLAQPRTLAAGDEATSVLSCRWPQLVIPLAFMWRPPAMWQSYPYLFADLRSLIPVAAAALLFPKHRRDLYAIGASSPIAIAWCRHADVAGSKHARV